MPSSEIAAWERSEPGTGPQPVYDDLNDKAIAEGWRRDSPPAAFSEFEDPFLEPVFVTLASIPYETRT